MENLGHIYWIENAVKQTKKAAEIKDWRLTRQEDREWREVAIEISKNRGYIIATPGEIKEKYGHLLPVGWGGGKDKDERMVWGIMASPRIGTKGLYSISLVKYF